MIRSDIRSWMQMMSQFRRRRACIKCLLLVLLLGVFALPEARAQSKRAMISVKFDRSAAPSMALASKQGVVVTGVQPVDRLNQQFAVRRIERIFRPAGKFEARHQRWGLDRWYRLEVEPTTDVAAAAEAYRMSKAVEAAAPEYEKVTQGGWPRREAPRRDSSGFFPNDPRYADQWHFNNTGQTAIPEEGETATPGVDINLPEAHRITTGSSNVIVSIVDTGLDLDHPEFEGMLWINAEEDINGNGVFDRVPASEGGDLNGVDDDGNGYVDDVVGYDFADNDPIPETVNPGTRSNSHGTHVAGTVAARNNNGAGVAGIAGGNGTPGSGARLMITQTFSENVGGFAEAIVYAADNGAVISNNSWAYTYAGVYEPAVLDAIDYFNANAGGPDAPIDGGVFVAAAGNSNSDADYYPGAYGPALTVSSTDDTDAKSSFSNYGPHVDIAAPGGQFGLDGVISTLHRDQGGYGAMSGTSMAAPHVAGAAALVASEMPGLSADDVKRLLANSGVDIRALNPGVQLGRRLDLARALEGTDMNPPSPIQDVDAALAFAEGVGASATLTWTATGDNGTTGTASAYDIRYSTSGPITDANVGSATPIDGEPIPEVGGTAQSALLDELPYDAKIWFSIRAIDAFGNVSEASNSPSITTGRGPAFSLSSESVGATLLSGETRSRSFVITNDGSDSLEVSFFGFAAMEATSNAGEQASTSTAAGTSMRTQISADHAKGNDDLGGTGAPVTLGAGGSSTSTYNWIDSNENGGPVYNWIDISAEGAVVGVQDESVTSFDLPFSFPFYGASYSRVGIGSNGYLVVGAGTSSDFANTPLPLADAPNGLIAPFWDDLDPSTSGTVYTLHDEDQDRLIIQYDDVARYGHSDRYTFQVILHKDGTILFQYQSMDTVDSATTGIEDPFGDEGLEVAFSTSYIEEGLAVAIQSVPPHLDLSPTSAALAQGEQQTFTVDFSAADVDSGTYVHDLTGTVSDASKIAELQVRTRMDVRAADFPFDLSLDALNESLAADASVTRMLDISNTTEEEQTFRIEMRGTAGNAPDFQPQLKGDEREKYNRLSERWAHLAGATHPSVGAPPSSSSEPLAVAAPRADEKLNLHAFGYSLIGSEANQIVQFDLDTPRDLSPKMEGPSMYAGDFSVGQQDRFYVITSEDNSFYSVTTDGEMTRIGASVPMSEDEMWGELASDPVTGELYGATTDGADSFLYTIDPTSGEATQVGEVEDVPVLISIAIDEHGQMYGLDIDEDILYRIDKATGAATALGSVGFDANYAQGMDYDLTTGRLYLAAYRMYNEGYDGHGELRIADTETGETTLIGGIGEGDGIGFLALNSVGFVRPGALAVTVAPGGSVSLPIEVSADGLYEGTYSGDVVVVSSDLPGQPSQAVPVTLTVDAEGQLTLDIDSLNYGSAFLTTSEVSTVLVSNTGRDAIDLTLSTNHDAYGILHASDRAFSLPAGVSREVEVVFAPESLGSKTGTLTIDRASGGSQEVALTGEGIPAPEVEVQPARFDLQAAPGQSYTRTLTVENTGGSPLTFSTTESVVSEPAPVDPEAIYEETIMSESFDDGIPSTWSVVDNAGDGVEWRSNSAWGRPNFAGSGGSAVADSDLAGPGKTYDTELISPEIEAADVTALRFAANVQMFNDDEHLDVDITTDAGATWTTVHRLAESIPEDGRFAADSGVEQRVSLVDHVSAGQTFQIRFRYHTSDPDPWDWYVQIDDVRVSRGFEYVTFTPASATVQPGQSLDVTYTIDTNGIPEGTYEIGYTLQTNAPADPEITVPFTLDVIESLAVNPEPQIGRDNMVHPGEEFVVDINVESLDDLEMWTYEMVVNYDSTVVEPVSIETVGTLSEDLSVRSSPLASAMWVGMEDEATTSTQSGPAPLAIEGEGTLMEIRFRAKNQLDSTEVSVSDVILGNGILDATEGESVVAVAPLFGDVTTNVRVSGQDAARVMQHAVGIMPLRGTVWIAGEVTGNGVLDAYDASRILSFSSEHISCFEVDEACRESGDGSGAALAQKASGTPSALAWGEPERAPSSEIGAEMSRLNIPLMLSEAEGPVFAFQVKTDALPGADVQAVNAQLPDGWLAAHRVDEGRIVIAAAGTEPLPPGRVATVTVDQSTPDVPLSFSGEATINENAPRSMKEREVVAPAKRFALHGNYPNPFRGTTNIAVDLPQNAHIDINIYDVIGRRVQALRGIKLTAGTGRTLQVDGRQLSAGVYVYRMIVRMGEEENVETGRMTVVR